MRPAGEGAQQLQQAQEAGEASGAVGVPHYSFEDPGTGRELGLFGREHLALIRHKLHESGLARHAGVTPECPHAFVVSNTA